MNDKWLELIQQPSLTSAILSSFLLIILSFVPFLPLPVVFGVIGYTFDFWLALLISWGSTTLGSFLMFLSIRQFFRKRAMDWIEGRQKIHTFFLLVERHAFLVILNARLIPVVPSIGVNIVCAVADIRWRTFLLATLIGKLPSIVIYTLAGNQIETHLWETVVILTLYSAALFVVSHWWRKRKGIES